MEGTETPVGHPVLQDISIRCVAHAYSLLMFISCYRLRFPFFLFQFSRMDCKELACSVAVVLDRPGHAASRENS